LPADGLAVLDGPAKLAAWVRVLSTGRGRKTDGVDAVSVGVAAWTASGLVSVQSDELAMALRALTEHGRRDLPLQRGGLPAAVTEQFEELVVEPA
jgi:transposase